MAFSVSTRSSAGPACWPLEFYYGKKLNELDLDEMASLAGIPKFPSSGNPISNPERARQRRDNYVLQRMADLKFVSQAEADAAKAVPMHATAHEPPVQVDAPYVAELVRQEMIARFGGDTIRCADYAIFGSPALSNAAMRAMFATCSITPGKELSHSSAVF